jgi:lysophospholipase L1-like esterase
MPKNQLTQSLWLLLLILGSLFLTSLLPSVTLGPITLRKVDLLYDIRNDEPDSLQAPLSSADTVPGTTPADTLLIQPKLVSYPCPAELTCLEDYSPGKKSLRPFFQAIRKKEGPVRIAFYGDSFIEGDILSGSLRDTLQLLYGGRGVGFVPLATEVPQYRLSIQHTFENWETYSLVSKQKTAAPLGLSGYAFIPRANNEVGYKPGRKQRPFQFDRIHLFYKSSAASTLTYQINDTLLRVNEIIPAEHLQVVTLEEENVKSIRLHFPDPDSIVAYGVSFEDDTGIYVDNFAMRGNSGMALSRLPEDLMKEFNEHQHYTLILLQYGLNIVTEKDSMDYIWYESKMVKTIDQLKAIFPEAGIVLIGISDRAGNIDGKIQTIPAITHMRDTQRKIAKRSQIAFWDLFEAMGGTNSIIDYVSAQPPLAAKDYTHLTFRGGDKIARKLADALLFERTRYEKKSPAP